MTLVPCCVELFSTPPPTIGAASPETQFCEISPKTSIPFASIIFNGNHLPEWKIGKKKNHDLSSLHKQKIPGFFSAKGRALIHLQNADLF